MSNFLAIATVTETLHQLLQAAVNVDVPGAGVTMTRPDGAGGGNTPRVNVYLYQVSENPHLRNLDLPTRRSNAALQTRPQVALDLHYLLSFFGNEAQLDPQRLMGSAVRTLNSFPVLTRRMINDTVASTALGFLAATNLADQDELVKLTPTDLSLEDLSKLWSVFFQTPFVLSVTYRASVVLIEGDETPLAALPVQERRIVVLPFEQPHIDEVRAQGAADPRAFIVANSVLSIRGHRLKGDVTSVRLSGHLVPPDTASDPEITLDLATLPGGVALRAGVQGVQVVDDVLFDTPSDPHRGFESNVVAFVLHPTVTAPALAGGVVTVNVAPPVRAGQRATLLLNQISVVDPAPAFAFALDPVPTADDATPQFATSGVLAGQYFVRLQVEGADSPLDLDPASANFGPRVTFP